MSKDINVTDGTVLETLNNKIDCDGGNYPGSGLEEYINTHNVGMQLFDTVLKDHVLTYEESKGLALQGTYVYKDAIAGERYGYPDFYAKCLEEYNEATSTETVNGVTVRVHSNGHQFYDIADKETVDIWFETYGFAWMYGIDQENERVFLPRDNEKLHGSLIESHIEGTNWYRVYSDGWCEQGGSITSGSGWRTISFVKQFKDLPNITTSCSDNGSKDSCATSLSINSITTSNFQCALCWASNSQWGYITATKNTRASWQACGYISLEEVLTVEKHLYLCVGNTVSDTSWVDVVTQVEGGVKDLEDKKNASIAEIDANAKSYNNLTNRQITNCLLEVPQNIKLELNNGTLTLKAGSIVTVPNGFEADGTTPKFDYITVESDATDAYTNGYVGKWLLYYSLAHNRLLIREVHVSYSGTTAPNGYVFWYNTTNNKVVRQENDGAWQDTLSLPIAEVTMGSNGSWSSINQIFNGMGYIGSTVWVDKGVKVLIPNGRNEDGSLINQERTLPKIVTYTIPSAWGKQSMNVVLNYNNGEVPKLESLPTYRFTKNGAINTKDTWTWTYYENDNKWFITGDTGATWSPLITGILGTLEFDETNVTSFNPKQPFRAVDYNEVILKSDKQEIISWCVPDYSAEVAISSGYIAPTIGVVNFSYRLNTSSSLKINNTSYGFGTSAAAYTATRYVVDKGDVITFSGADATARFCPLKGAK